MRGRTSAELKQLAKQALLGKYGTAVGAVLVNYAVAVGIGLAIYFFAIVGIMVLALSGVGTSGTPFIIVIILVVAIFFAALIIEYMLMPGYVNLHFNICRGRRYALGDLLFAFKNAPGKFLLIAFILVGLVVVMSGISFVLSLLGIRFHGFAGRMILQWGFMLLTYVIMLVFSLNFGQTLYILVDDPQKGIMEALRESYRMMHGHRGRYFRLILSFIGWAVLAYLSFGLAFLWLAPYMGCTFTYFYMDLREQQAAAYVLPEELTKEYPLSYQEEPDRTRQAQVFPAEESFPSEENRTEDN